MAGKSRTGVKGSYQKGGLNVEGEYTMADALAGLAFVTGLGMIAIPVLGTIPGTVLLGGSGTYFGAKYMFTGNKALTNPSGENLIFFAAGAGIVYYCMKKKGGSASDGPTLFASAPPVRSLPASVHSPVSAPVDATPAVSTTAAAVTASGGAGASPTRGQVIPLPRSQDTNLWWWPDEEAKENLGFFDNTIRGAQYVYDRLTGMTEDEATEAAYETWKEQEGLAPPTEEEKERLEPAWEEPGLPDLPSILPEPPSLMDFAKPVAIVGGTGLLIYLVMRKR